MSCNKNNDLKQYNNQNHPNNQNPQNSGQQNSDKTSAEVAAEMWDSWLGNPDDHEISRNLKNQPLNP